MEIDLFPSDIRIDTALSLRRHLTIPKSIACTSRLLSHKLQIARYYRAAFFSTRYTRLYIRIKLFVFDPCGVLKLLPHNIFHFRCHCWSSKMTVVDENFYIQGNDRNFDESYDFAPCGLLYRRTPREILKHTLHTRYMKNTMYTRNTRARIPRLKL